MNNDIDRTDDELNKIFSKHIDTNLIKKYEVTFDANLIKKNKKEIEELKKHNLLKEEKHFNLEDEDEIFKSDSDINEKQRKKENYFNNIMQETLHNDNLYCSYLDYFDKIWMNKNKKGKAISEGKSISCAGCFNTTSYDAHPLKHFNNMYITSSLVNCYMDFMEIYKWDEFINLIQTNSRNFNEKQLKELNIEKEFKEKTELVGIKCKNCLMVIGVFNSQDNKYIMFNSI